MKSKESLFSRPISKVVNALFLLTALFFSLPAHCQRLDLRNEEYNLVMQIDLTNQDIIIPEHELYGPVAGFIGKANNNFYWIAVSAKSTQKGNIIELINDFGSENLTAKIVQINDSIFEFTQLKGSALKLPEKGKWQKLPTTLTFRNYKRIPKKNTP